MDTVVVTCAKDAHLLRFFLASYESFWEGGGKLILFTRRSDSYLWEDIRLPANTVLVYREDFPDLVRDDFLNQLYLKLIAHRFVDSEYFVVMDSDFLFVAPCAEEMFYFQGKPVWFVQRFWDEASAHRRPSLEEFAGERVDFQFMTSKPQFVFARDIAAELCRRLDVRRAMDPNAGEFHIYGWFAHRYFPQRYHWCDTNQVGVLAPIGRCVNQVPPSYCVLDPLVTLDQFPGARYLAFWSHWDLAEAKMSEFLQAAHQQYPERPLQLPKACRIFPTVDIPAGSRSLYSSMHGLYLDGWVKEEVWFAVEAPPPGSALLLQFDVLSGPVAGCFQIGAQTPVAFRFEAGLNELPIHLNSGESRYPILLRFDDQGSTIEDSTGRKLRARLMGLQWRPDPNAVEAAEGLSVPQAGEAALRESPVPPRQALYADGMFEAPAALLREIRAQLQAALNRADSMEAAAAERLSALRTTDAALQTALNRADSVEAAAAERLSALRTTDAALQTALTRADSMEAAAAELLSALRTTHAALQETRLQLQAALGRVASLEALAAERLAAVQVAEAALEETRGEFHRTRAELEQQIHRFENEPLRDYLKRRWSRPPGAGL